MLILECHSKCWNSAPHAGSTHAAQDYDATTTMLDCCEGTVVRIAYKVFLCPHHYYLALP